MNTHLSIRVPWRDRPWDDRICDRPLDNSSCLLLANIGDKRDDEYEVAMAGLPVDEADTARLACLSERATFMSRTGYRVVKTHPYSKNKHLEGHLQPTDVVMPGFAFEAVPFRWLNRRSFYEDIWPNWQFDFDADAEDRVDRILGFKPTWIMDAHNQIAVIRNFFEPVVPGESLVFIYLKHSPFQDESPGRLLVGAARVTNIQFPPMWNQAGTPPFESSMWETAVVHSLRREMKDGILLPYQDLVTPLDQGVDIDSALAWAPENRATEFSYVTEHVSDDAAIEALGSLQRAAEGCRSLGLTVPDSATDWVESQIERLWNLRGPTPGLGSVLVHLGVKGGHSLARKLLADQPADADPWAELAGRLCGTLSWPPGISGSVPKSVETRWRALDKVEKDALRVLSTMDITVEQVEMLMSGNTTVELTLAELLDNPYFATVCTYQDPLHVGFSTVDRACYPPSFVGWSSVLPEQSRSDDPADERRVEALLTDELELLASQGDTLATQEELIGRASEMNLAQECRIDVPLLRGYGLDSTSLASRNSWSPLSGAETSDGAPALKLTRLADVKDIILQEIEGRRKGKRFAVGFDPRSAIDAVLHSQGNIEAEEELARTEKADGLAELFSSRLSVLVGPAGTGKTTLLRALADLPDIQKSGVLLLAPTGKAALQLQSKVGQPAQTLASYLIKLGGYDARTGAYQEVPDSHTQHADLVVIDEASMLTEEMLAATLGTLGRVDRLVLVGDPRQLPPIGAGRPFVDLVESLTPAQFKGATRVGPGFVELTVLRRQAGRDRDDLLLARWFGGADLSSNSDEVWQHLRTGHHMTTLQAVPWENGDVTASLMEVLGNELDLTAAGDIENAFKVTYGGQLTTDGRYVNWYVGPGGAGEHCEDWQILSPTRSRAFGTVELNRHIKRSFRTKDMVAALRRWGWRSSKPIGPELLVRGDKVMQTRNQKLKSFPQGTGASYVANGDIGVIVGSWSKASKMPPASVEFASQPGARYSYWPSAQEDPPLELAWAVTVHKAQGSEFGTTILVLPRRAHVSRELMYTALTRQTRRIVILHEGTIEDLRAIADPSNSETARRLTDLFRTPKPRDVKIGTQVRRFDANLIHVAARDVVVRSKNEVIIADILESVAPGRWRYEEPLIGADGTHKLPDFTVAKPSGETVIWEHLGMLDNPRYAHDWEVKKKWYADNGILPHDDPSGGGINGSLMWTDDRGGVNKPEWQRLAEQVIGPIRSARPAKKATAKKRRGAKES